MTPKANKKTANLANLKNGEAFIFGGREWIKLEATDGGTLALTKDLVCQKAFDKGNCNDWRTSTLREWLNSVEGFIGELGCENYNNWEPFKKITSDLTADSGEKDYGTAEDYIALLTADLYRKYRDIIPPAEDWWWLITPWAIKAPHSCYVRYVLTTGALYFYAYGGSRGVRPLCNLKSDIKVEIPATDGDEPDREARIDDAVSAVIDELQERTAGLGGKAKKEVLTRILTCLILDENAYEDDDAEGEADD